MKKTKNSLYSTFAVGLLFTIALFITQASSQDLDLDKTFTAGVSDSAASVFYSKTLANGKILIAGGFTSVNGTSKSHLVRLNSDGTLDNTFNMGGIGANNTVYNIIVQDDGKILIGGAFSKYNNVSIGGLARLNSDGTFDTTFNSGGQGTPRTVQGMALQSDGKIIISGSQITSYNGTQSFSVVRVNADGTLDTGFTSPFTNGNFIENVIVQPDGKILVGGSFSIGKPQRDNIVRLNSDGSIDSTFLSNGGGSDSDIYAMELLSNGKILIGGVFDTYNGSTSRKAALLNSDGTRDSSFLPAFGSTDVIEDFAVQSDGKILATGYIFVEIGLRFSVIRLNIDGSPDGAFQSETSDKGGYNVEVQPDGKIILTGLFVKYGDDTKLGIARLNNDGSVDSSFNTSFTDDGVVSAIAQQPDGKILVGGEFRKANGEENISVVRFNLDGTVDSSFSTGTGVGADPVTRFNFLEDIDVQSDGKILVVGAFGSFNSQTATSLVRLNSDGSIDNTFNIGVFDSGPINLIRKVEELPDGKILIGGIFYSFGQSQTLVRLNSDGSIDNSFAYPSSGTFGQVLDIDLLESGKILISGSVINPGTGLLNRIARLNSDGSIDSSFNFGTGPNSAVFSTDVQDDGKLIIAGSFTSYNGTPRNRIARLDADGTLDTSFDPGSSANTTITEVSVQNDGKILIGGSFITYNGNASVGIARINSDGSFDDTYTSGINPNDSSRSVRSIFVQSDGNLLIGGSFNSYNGVARNSLARLTQSVPASTRFDYDGDGKADLSVFRPSDRIWYLNQSTEGFKALQFGLSTDKIVPADYDGDGKTDVAVFRDGTWYLLQSTDGFLQVQFGVANDIPTPADFDGDDKAELAVYREGVWYVLNLVNNQSNVVQFGIAGDKTVAADYDGDGKADYAVYRPSEGVWYVLQSTAGFTATNFGLSNDIPLTGDFDGDGKSDLAIYRPSEGTWYVSQSTDGVSIINFGISTDLPVPADYDGDGKADRAVYRDGVWYQLNSSQGIQIQQFGLANDKPTPNAFVQ